MYCPQQQIHSLSSFFFFLHFARVGLNDSRTTEQFLLLPPFGSSSSLTKRPVTSRTANLKVKQANSTNRWRLWTPQSNSWYVVQFNSMVIEDCMQLKLASPSSNKGFFTIVIYQSTATTISTPHSTEKGNNEYEESPVRLGENLACRSLSHLPRFERVSHRQAAVQTYLFSIYRVQSDRRHTNIIYLSTWTLCSFLDYFQSRRRSHHFAWQLKRMPNRLVNSTYFLEEGVGFGIAFPPSFPTRYGLIVLHN